MEYKEKFYKSTWFLWLMLFTVSPVGIILAWKYQRFTVQTRKILTGVFGIYFVVMILVANLGEGATEVSKPLPVASPTSKPATSSAVKPASSTEVKPTTSTVKPTEPTQTKAPEVTAPPTDLKEYISWLVNGVAGEKSNFDNAARIRSVDIDTKSTFIEIMADDNFSTGLIKTDILSTSTKIFKKFFVDRTDVPKLYLSWCLPLQDAKGNESISPVLTISLTKENAGTFNWDKFEYSNLPKTADSYFEHAIFRK